jgi:hypothetical protein
VSSVFTKAATEIWSGWGSGRYSQAGYGFVSA